VCNELIDSQCATHQYIRVTACSVSAAHASVLVAAATRRRAPSANTD
jgi:hypothetical protein